MDSMSIKASAGWESWDKSTIKAANKDKPIKAANRDKQTAAAGMNQT